MNTEIIIDFLTYRSWWYQIHWYGMSKESARKIFKDWKAFEEKDRLDYLQGIVGGLIEVVNITTFDDEESDGNDLILNEEGLLLDLPPNPWSQFIGFNSIWEAQTFFGDLILIDGCLD